MNGNDTKLQDVYEWRMTVLNYTERPSKGFAPNYGIYYLKTNYSQC